VLEEDQLWRMTLQGRRPVRHRVIQYRRASVLPIRSKPVSRPQPLKPLRRQRRLKALSHRPSSA
jgi:hypothetical protein